MNYFTDFALKRITSKASRRELQLVQRFQSGEGERVSTLATLARDIAIAGQPARANELFALALHIARHLNCGQARSAALTEIAVQYAVANGSINPGCSDAAGGAEIGSFRANGYRGQRF